MYKDIETETSYKYLKIVISELKEPIFILGGWAVFFILPDDITYDEIKCVLADKSLKIEN